LQQDFSSIVARITIKILFVFFVFFIGYVTPMVVVVPQPYRIALLYHNPTRSLAPSPKNQTLSPSCSFFFFCNFTKFSAKKITKNNKNHLSITHTYFRQSPSPRSSACTHPSLKIWHFNIF
jgi:hypothetical protein